MQRIKNHIDMKKTLLSLLCFSAFFAVNGQNNQLQAVNKTISFGSYTSSKTSTLNKATATCSNDTIEYVIAKASAVSALSINNATSAQSVAQYFNTPQDITVHGTTFFAWKSDNSGGVSLNVLVELYLAGSDSMPTGAPLASETVVVDTTFGGGSLNALEKNVTFSSPITVSQPYLIVVSNLSANGMSMIFNSYGAGDGAQEWLSSLDLFGTWTRSYNVNVGGVPFDADALIYPHVSYDLDVDFTANPLTFITAPTNVVFTDNSSAILQDRMYNQAAFQAAANQSYSYDFGDGSPAVNSINTSHDFTAVQTYDVTLSDTLYGWRTNCTESETVTLNALTPANIVITEIMYNTPSTDSAEYIEIYNNGPTSVDLTNYSFSTGVNYTFPNTSINTGEYFVITLDSVDFYTIYGYAPDAEWTSGNLVNSSESITIIDNLGNTIDSVNYDDGGPNWPTGTDGQGASIVLCDVNADNNDGNNWSASTRNANTTIGGTAIFASPGLANLCCTPLTGTDNTTICAEDSITINGTMYYAGNSTGTEVFNLPSGCDSTVTVALNVLPALTGDVNNSISSNDNIVVNGTTYDANNLTGTEIFTNVGPNGCDSTVTINLSIIPDLVITEIMYNTPSTDSAEYIEIYNNGPSSIDLTNYSFSTGVNYTFPNVSLNAGDYFVITLDSIDFYTIYGYSPDAEWTSGNLVNTSEAITIADSFGNVVDSVNYDDGGVWPTDPDGNGASLILCDANSDNNDGNNWAASTKDAGTTIGGVAIFASPGLANVCCTPLSGTNNTTICANESIVINGNTYDATTSTGTEVFTNVGPNGCDSTVTVALNVLPALTGNNNTTICANESIVINGNTYDATTSTGTEVFTNVGPNGCDSTVTVALNVLPALTGTHNETVCDGGSIVVNGTTYDASNLTGTEVFTNVGPNGCDSTVTVTLTIDAAIDVTVTNASPTLTANQAGATYRWLDCNTNNSIIPAATSQSYTAIATGDYAVEITVGNCVDTSACENVMITGVNFNDETSNLNIYPNPTTGIFTIDLGKTNNASIIIYDVLGKVIVNETSISTVTQIDLSGHNRGIYFVNIQTENDNIVKRITLQ